MNFCVLYYTYFWFKYNLGQKYHAPQVQPDRGSNSWPPDHDSTVHANETPAHTGKEVWTQATSSSPST